MLLVAQLGFAVWSLGLLLVGIRVVHGWTTIRSLGVVASAVLLLAAVVGVLALV